MTSLSAESALRTLAHGVWGIVFVACGLACIAGMVQLAVPPILHDADFVSRYAVLDGFLYPKQPAKSIAFQACVIAAPIFILAGIFVGQRIIARLDTIALHRWLRIGLTLHLLFFAACIRPLFYYPHPPVWLPPRWLLCPLPFPPPVPAWEWIGCVLFALGLCFALMAKLASRRAVIGIVVALAVLCAPVEFYAPSQVTDDTAFTYHLNAMLDAISQSMNGHHLLVDFPHIYGGYGEMLAPGLALFPHTMAVLLIAVALPTLLGIWFWIASAFQLVRNPFVLALTGAGLLGVTFLSALPPNYCYGTPRTLFPSLVLLLAIGYFRRPGTASFWIVSALAAIASIWNLDTGLVLVLAWTLTLLAGDAAARAWKTLAFHLLAQASLFLLAWIAFLFYLRVASGHAPDLGLLFYFQSMVVKSGYFCTGMIVPSAWTFVVLLYLTGLVVAALAHRRRRVPWKGRLVLMLSLMGVGMFSYYMGRSAEGNLISVSPPGILLAGLLGSEMLARVRRGILPPITHWFFLPWAVMIFWWGFLFFAQLPVIFQSETRLVDAVIHPKPSLVQINAAFAAQHVRPGEAGVYFLSGHSGFYYYLTGTTRSLRIPGNVELLQTRDMQALIDAITAGKIPKLFVEENFWTMDMYRADVYAKLRAAIVVDYRRAGVSPDGKLSFMVPQP